LDEPLNLGDEARSFKRQHYPSAKTLDRLARVSEFIAPAHCSGNEAKAYVQRKYPEKFVSVRTGSAIEI